MNTMYSNLTVKNLTVEKRNIRLSLNINKFRFNFTVGKRREPDQKEYDQLFRTPIHADDPERRNAVKQHFYYNPNHLNVKRKFVTALQQNALNSH